MIRELENHLWQSTLFACLAALLTVMLRRNRAALRHGLWLAASLKFLVPFSILIGIGSQVEWRKAPVLPEPRLVAVEQFGEQIGEPFALPASALPAAPALGKPNRMPAVFFGVWLCGFAAYSVAWYRCWRRVRSALHAATPLPLKLPIRAMSSPVRLEPGLFGIRKPVLLLPEGIADHLTPAQFEAVVAHELCHVRRRDNLAAAIHMAVEALFWFHPLVWWIGRRLVEERERACDEAVLGIAADPQDYAEGIVKVCRFYLESPLVCVPGVTGGNLKQRVEEIMLNRRAAKLNFGRKLMLGIAGMIAVAGPLAVGILDSPKARAQSRAQVDWQTAAGGKMAFDVASIKPSEGGFTPPGFPLDAGNAFTPTGGRFFANFPLLTFITFAYKIRPTPDQRRAMLSHLPAWIGTDQFTIEAKGPANATKDQFRLMMQSLLADRFKLAAHFETREAPVYGLTLIQPGKLGKNLRPHSEGPPCPATAERPAPGGPAKIDVFPSICEAFALTAAPDHSRFLWGSRNSTMADLASSLPTAPFSGPDPAVGAIDRPVVDQTGLSGTFDFKIEYAIQSADPTPFGVQPDPSGPGFLEALREQLGLKLQPTKGQVQTLVIDHVEKPSEN